MRSWLHARPRTTVRRQAGKPGFSAALSAVAQLRGGGRQVVFPWLLMQGRE